MIILEVSLHIYNYICNRQIEEFIFTKAFKIFILFINNSHMIMNIYNTKHET